MNNVNDCHCYHNAFFFELPTRLCVFSSDFRLELGIVCIMVLGKLLHGRFTPRSLPLGKSPLEDYHLENCPQNIVPNSPLAEIYPLHNCAP